LGGVASVESIGQVDAENHDRDRVGETGLSTRQLHSYEGDIPSFNPKSSSHTGSSDGGGISSSIRSAGANIAFRMGVGGPSSSPTY
jgi:hypothetical protein